jgi:hypothetical protein
MGSGHVGSIPLLAALATRLEQATVAEAIIRRAGYPESMLYGPAKAQRVADSPNPATKPGHTGQNRARWPAVDERGRADGQCQARRVQPRPGRRG